MSCPDPSVAGAAPLQTVAHPLWRLWMAAWSVTAVFILSNSATPLYVRWQREIGFSSAILTVIFAAYILGLLLTLLIAGQFSDRYGRRVVLLPGLAAALFACVLFARAESVATLVTARFLSGIAVGVVVSAGMAAVVDFGGSTRKQQASLIASVAMVLGAGLGPLLAGGIALASPNPIAWIFATEFLALSTALVAVLILPFDTRHARADRNWRPHLPRVPRANHRHLSCGIAVFGPGITATSFVLALGPSLLSQLLGIASPLIAGGMACAMFLTATSVQFLARRLPLRTIFLLGAVATFLAMTGIVVAVISSNVVVLMGAALLAGSGQGLGQLGGLTLIGLHVPGSHRAEANAVLNIGGYLPAGLMPVVTGLIIDKAGLFLGATVFASALASLALVGGAKAFRGVDR